MIRGEGVLKNAASHTLLMFLDVGIKVEDLQEMDLWQYFGHLFAAKENARRKVLLEKYSQKTTYLLFGIAQSLGMKARGEEFFSFEKEINQIFSGEKKDLLDGEGEYVIDPNTGEEVWVYNMKGLNNLRRK